MRSGASSARRLRTCRPTTRASSVPATCGTWVAIVADTKLVPSWAVGRRDGFTATAIIHDLADRPSTRVQLTTDGHKPYLEAVEAAFGS
jgi:hypothetical protein